MKYPIILHTDNGQSYGVIVPDFPGCFSAGDDREEALANVQDALETHVDPGEVFPEPSTVEAVQATEAAEGGEVVLVDVDMEALAKGREV